MKPITLLTAVVSLSLTSIASASIIYSENFSGNSTTDLAGQAPQVRPATEVWLGDPAFKDDGSVAGSSLVYLPFTPSASNIYTLSFTLNPTLATNNWLAGGFSTGGGAPLFSAGGGPWFLKTGNGAVSLFSDATNNQVNPGSYNIGAATSFSIALNTTNSLWSVDWKVNGSSVNTFTYTTNPSIDGVMLQSFSMNGSVGAFSLDVTPVPEPSSIALLGLGAIGVVLVRLRRRNC